MKTHDWTKFVLANATLNGWPSFVTHTSKTDKLTGEKVVTEILMHESAQGEDGMHVFADTGSSMSYGQAMSYGKVLREHNDSLWQEFSQEYEILMGLSMKPSVVKVVTKTSAQVEKEKAFLKEQRRWEKEWEKNMRKTEKMLKKTEKAREKAEKEAEKAREKEEKKAEKVVKAAQKEVEKIAVKEEKARKAVEKAVKRAEKEQEKESKMAIMLNMVKWRSTPNECIPGEQSDSDSDSDSDSVVSLFDSDSDV
jgi:flagellar biosynthesis GTPase FlhF